MVVDRLEVWTPTPGNPVSLDDVRLWLTEMCRSYKAKLLYDPSQAYLMIEQIRRAGIRTEEFISADHRRARSPQRLGKHCEAAHFCCQITTSCARSCWPYGSGRRPRTYFASIPVRSQNTTTGLSP